MFPRPLPRARAVWISIIGVPLAIAVPLDIWCDRGEPDSDTLSEYVRVVIDAIPGGRKLFLAGCIGVPACVYRHISKEWT